MDSDVSKLLVGMVAGLVWGTAVSIFVRWLADRNAEREIARIHESYGVVLQTKANVEQYGRARPAAAVTEDAEPSPEERARFEVTEEAVAKGALELFNNYREIGLPVSIEDCRIEARQIILGMTPEPPVVSNGLRD